VKYMDPKNKLISAPVARASYLGGVTAMTEWRWRKAGMLPEPIRINRRCYYREADLLAFQAAHAAPVEGGAE